jgi:uncharacterized protein (TIGR03083 family)
VTDYESAYRDLRLRVTDLLHDRPDETLDQTAPATPAWRVRDVVAHLGGVCDDIAHGNMDGVATESWTQAQVDKRRDWPFDQVLADWSEHAGVVEPMLNGIGSPIGQLVFDAWTHEQDVRGALHEPGAREGPAVDIAWDWFIAESESVGARLTAVRASRYELLRGVTGRRSLAQMRALDENGAVLDGVLSMNGVFTPARSDIIE